MSETYTAWLLWREQLTPSLWGIPDIVDNPFQGTYGGIVRSETPMWSSRVPDASAVFGEWRSLPPRREDYPAYMRVPEGL